MSKALNLGMAALLGASTMGCSAEEIKTGTPSSYVQEGKVQEKVTNIGGIELKQAGGHNVIEKLDFDAMKQIAKEVDPKEIKRLAKEQLDNAKGDTIEEKYVDIFDLSEINDDSLHLEKEINELKKATEERDDAFAKRDDAFAKRDDAFAKRDDAKQKLDNSKQKLDKVNLAIAAH